MSDAAEAALGALSGAPAAQRREALATIAKLLRNLVNSPEEEKFRRIRTTNPAIAQRLFPACFDLLKAIGFEESGEFLIFRREVGPELAEVLDIVDALLLTLEPVPGQEPAPRPKAAPEDPQRRKEQRQTQALQAQAKAQASAQQQLAALRQQRATRYQEQQDTALAHHLSSSHAEQPFDAIAALNESRGAVYSFVTCTSCGTSLRYNSATHAQAVLCPCGNLIQPEHLTGQVFRRRAPSDLPLEPGEPVDQHSRPRAVGGPNIQVAGPDGSLTQMPLYSVLQMVRQHGEQQQVGADGQTIQALPTRKFDGKGVADSERCEICQEDFEEGEELRTLPCFHLFHSKCVDQWLQVNSICPICRHKVGS